MKQNKIYTSFCNYCGLKFWTIFPRNKVCCVCEDKIQRKHWEDLKAQLEKLPYDYF